MACFITREHVRAFLCRIGLGLIEMHNRTRIKVCGITRPEDAHSAVAAGVDALGLVFYAPSPRSLDISAAQKIAQSLPAFVGVVALFVDADKAYVDEVINRVRPDLLQFHGDEDEAYCSSFERPYMKALRVQADTDIAALAKRYSSARSLLLDSYQAGVAGGTGTAFDWSLVPEALRRRIVLAGGLTAANVGAAIRQVEPYAVDVSGGVEHSKGIKDPEKIQQFVAQVNAAHGSLPGDSS